MRWEAREGGRCAEVRANWRPGAALNWREKREKAGSIEGEKEGFSKSFSKVSFLKKDFLDMFWGSFRGI